MKSIKSLTRHATAGLLLLAGAPVASGQELPFASFPTTVTAVASSTFATTMSGGADQPFEALVMRTIETGTLLEEWASAPTSFPHTVVQVNQLQRTYETTITRSPGDEDPWMTTSVTRVDVPSTWIVYEPEPTHAVRGTDEGMSCGACAAEEWVNDERCARLGLDTACQGQCDTKYGYLWCYQRYRSDHGNKVMGRACWGKGTEYMQLVEPCSDIDHALACVPCEGLDRSWEDINWYFLDDGE